MTDIETAIERGLAYLARKQLSSGAFPVHSWSDSGLVSKTLEACIFPTATIAHSLSFSRMASAKAMLASAAKFLVREMEHGSLWRYWARDDPHHFDVAPDADDTACASALLRQQGIRFPNNRKLLLANRDPKGLFYTWVTPRLRWNRSLRYWVTVLPQLRHPRRVHAWWKTGSKPDDVDCVVNANVLFYLGRGPETQPVADYIVDVIDRQKERECDKWYSNPLVIYYFISRCFASGVVELAPARDAIVERILAATKEDHDRPALDTAAAICALLDWNTARNLADGITLLLRRQKEDGSWEKAAICRADVNRWGSGEWTTGFCLEALTRYQERRRNG